MTLRPYDLRDPGEVVRHVLADTSLATHRPGDGDAFLVLVHDPPGAQQVVHTTPVAATIWSSMSQPDRSTFLRERVHEMPIDTDTCKRPEHAVVTVVARSGLAVFGAYERDWLLAWRYANHLAPVFAAGPVLVTEHGWVDLMSERGGSEPRIVGNRPSSTGAARTRP